MRYVADRIKQDCKKGVTLFSCSLSICIHFDWNKQFARPNMKREGIFNCISKKYNVRVSNGFHCLRVWSSGGLFEHGNEPSGSIQGGEFLDHLSEFKFLYKDSALLS
jgi:hypothetical protein